MIFWDSKFTESIKREDKYLYPSDQISHCNKICQPDPHLQTLSEYAVPMNRLSSMAEGEKII